MQQRAINKEHLGTGATKNRELTVLGIETSCDETAAAIVSRDLQGNGVILSNIVRSQFKDHAPYGGVVPEIAARAHVQVLDTLIEAALAEASLGFSGLNGIAATAGPGLIGGVLAGFVTAKAIALVRNLPLAAVNHLEGHALTVGLTEGLHPPYLLLLVSGGHTEFLRVRAHFDYQKLGGTIDDALGEAFDKVAKMLRLGFPGGPAVERAAANGDPSRFALPRPLVGRVRPDFSFSGLKTAVRQAALTHAPLSRKDVADLCASFQAAAAETLRDRLRAAFRLYDAEGLPKRLVAAGGVAANRTLRDALLSECEAFGYTFHAPPPSLCTDNAAMIAWAGACRIAAGHTDGLDAPARARWPICETSAPNTGCERQKLSVAGD
ncbi:MAG: tRNA (adenosine(37)-N6)-threonylcarbamoyltransferase complex transferase subunit TsaD [Rhodomicrobium sp.]